MCKIQRKEDEHEAKQTTENETVWLCVEAGAGPSPATHTQEAFVCGGDHGKVEDVLSLDPIDCFPKEQSKHISAKYQGPPPLDRKVC